MSADKKMVENMSQCISEHADPQNYIPVIIRWPLFNVSTHKNDHNEVNLTDLEFNFGMVVEESRSENIL